MTKSRRTAVVALISTVVALVASVAFAATRGRDDGWSMMRFGPGMMGYGPSGGGDRVDDIGEARDRAESFADRLDLRVGEVMQFSNHYYAELEDADRKPATEVLVNPRRGAVWLEPGPAMMWNTRYGMMSGNDLRGAGGMMGAGMMGAGMMRGGMMGPTTGSAGPDMMGGDARAPGATENRKLSGGEAQRIASRWLERDGDGLTAGPAEPFPGYYTLHVMRASRPAGMLSVNAATGAVWAHPWHGRFVRMSE